jgi:exodeoxyribonuclease VII small subunit
MTAKSKSKPSPAVETLSFEEAFAEMEAVVRQLEDGELPLDESLALFERGQALSARCRQLLEAADLKVQQLLPKAGGGYGLEPFDESVGGGR